MFIRPKLDLQLAIGHVGFGAAKPHLTKSSDYKRVDEAEWLAIFIELNDQGQVVGTRSFHHKVAVRE